MFDLVRLGDWEVFEYSGLQVLDWSCIERSVLAVSFDMSVVALASLHAGSRCQSTHGT